MNFRLFCALPVPVALQTELAAAANALKGALSPATASWVKSGNFHLTLSFLGDVEEARVDELVLQLQNAAKEMSRFELVCGQLGCFPNLNRPRVIWAGVRSKGDELSQLQSRVAGALAPWAQRQEKQHFEGHITLGRLRFGEKPPRDGLAREIQRHRDGEFGRWEVQEVELLRSDLSQGTPRYSVLHRAPLPGSRI